MSSFNTSVTQSGDNTLAGGATEATQLQVLAELQKQAEFSETVWVDATGTFFIRRVVYSENLETYTVSYTLADGSAYSPTAPIEPASAGTDREIVQTSYTVIVAGTGYSIGDIVQQLNIFDVQSDTLQSTIWYNQTTDAIITPAPTITDLQPEGSLTTIGAEIGATNESAAATDTSTSGLNGLIKRLLQRVTTLIGLYPGSLGQKTSANSFAVVVASDQSTLPISVVSLPLPTGAATETTLSTVATNTGTTATNTGTTATNTGTISTATGAQADAAYTSGSGSIISILKGIFGRVAQAYTITPAATQTACQFTVNAAVTSGNNSSATATTPTEGVRNVSITNNSGIVVDLTTGGTPGGAGGTSILTAIPGDSFTIPFAITNGVVLCIKPTSGNLTSSDYVQVRCS